MAPGSGGGTWTMVLLQLHWLVPDPRLRAAVDRARVGSASASVDRLSVGTFG